MADINTPKQHKLFLSYSRQELYFAESLVKELSPDFDIWFDIQRLRPGIDWAAEIRSGLDDCDALVLVASETSLHSPYVADEWERVLFERKMPLYILVFESVRFEPYTVLQTDRVLRLDLLKAQATGIIDCRRTFQRSVTRLRTSIQAYFTPDSHPAPQPEDRIPAPIKFDLSFRGKSLLQLTIPTLVPIPVAAVALSLLLNIAVVTFLLVTIFWIRWPLVVVGIATTALLFNQLLEFLARRFRYNQIRWTLLVVGLLTLPAAFGLGQTWIALQAILWPIALWQLFNSKALLHWAPRGQGPAALRHGFFFFQKYRAHFSSSPTEMNYVVYANPADSCIADKVREIMNKAGFTEGWKETEHHTDIRLCILSNRSTVQDFAAITDTSDQLIWIVASHLADIGPYRVYSNRQWVDWRTQSPIILRRMAEELRPDHDETVYRELSVNVTPEDFAQRLIPSSAGIFNIILFIATGCLAGLVGLAAIRSVEAPSPEVIGFGLILPIAVSLLLIRFSNWLTSRELGYFQGGLIFLLPVAAVTFLALKFLPALVVAGWLLFVLVTGLRLWLPPRSQHGLPFFSFRRHLPLWRRNVFIFIVIALIVNGLLGDTGFNGTPTTPVESIRYEPISPVPSLTLSVPSHWLTRPIADETALSQFGRETQFATPLFYITGAIGYGDVAFIGENSAISDLHAQKRARILAREAQLNWVALNQELPLLAPIVLSVWTTIDNRDANVVLADKTAELLRSGNPTMDTSLSDTTIKGNGNSKFQCYHILSRVHSRLVEEEWYCAKRASKYIVFISASGLIANEQRPVINHILELAVTRRSIVRGRSR